MVAENGKVISVNISANTGEQKHDVGRRMTKRGFGLEGDAHAGDWHRQVSLLAEESIDGMRERGLEVDPGAFGENITTRGIDLSSLPVGTRLGVGEEVVLEVTQIGKECLEPCAIYYEVGDCVMPREGIFTSVVTSGEISTGDSIRVIEEGSS